MAEPLKPPIILLGNTRSGTTIVQDLLAEHPDVVAWYEPRTLWLCADPVRPHDEFDERDASASVKRYVRKRFLAYQRRFGNRIVMEKTPANIFKIPYVRAIFPEAKYLYVVRHPLSFIASVELKWQRPVTTRGIRRRLRSTPVTQLHVYAAQLLRQQFEKRVRGRKYLSVWGPRYDGMQQDIESGDMLRVIARQWARGSKKAARDLESFEPGQVHHFRYEDFVTDPLSHLQRIAVHCGLDMTAAMERAARERVDPDRREKWRRFDARDLARVLPELEHEMGRHGYEVPAEIAAATRNA